MLRVGATHATLLLCLGLGFASPVLGQCMIGNPSFELGGSGGAVFDGWNQFGTVASSGEAAHGTAAALVEGPNLGSWQVSAFWQRLDSTPGDRWAASVHVRHAGVAPLTGQSSAILNIEWRDVNGDLISYESHTAADAATPVDETIVFSVESGPAPTGTVATRFLLGVLQSPTDPTPQVIYDLATFDKVGPPSLDDLQWSDFPGGRTLSFSGHTWRVKGPGFYSPGPNWFCDGPGCTWVDTEDRLHLTIQNDSGNWVSTELVLEDALGYGDYVFTSLGRLDTLDPNVILGLFLWQYGPCYDPANGWWNPYNEIDVEFSRWGNPSNDLGQFVSQPYDFPGNTERFDATFADGEITSHGFRWLADRIEYRSWRGGPQDEAQASLIHAWTYTGPHIPRPEQPRVHINLWHISPPGEFQEVVLDAFTFVPEGSTVGIADGKAGLAANLLTARPNPFGSRTTVRYIMADPGRVRIHIYDVFGRLVRRLADAVVSAGDHEIEWDGSDDSGNPLPSGVYFHQLRAGRHVQTHRITLVR